MSEHRSAGSDPVPGGGVAAERTAILRRVDIGNGDGPFRPDWQSLRGYRVPGWYLDAKFGIFIHWGPYSVPGFGSEWYPREMYRPGTSAYDHHRKTYGPQDRFGYKDFLADFTASRFDPVDWADLFRRAGAQFVVGVGEHHDGFPMYATDLTRWNAARYGPRRDVIGELAHAVRDRSMVFGVSSHRAEHWWFFNGGMGFDSDVRDPRYVDLYGPAQREEVQPTEPFLEDWLARTVDMVERSDAQLVWFDWWIEQPAFRPYLARFAAWYYNRAATRNRPVAINYKFAAFDEGTAIFDVERGQTSGIRPMLWQNDTSVAVSSWGWVHDQSYKDIRDILGDLVDVVSKNGALLLNVGPRADGSFEPAERDLLERIGQWLNVNGEAIYGTRPFTVAGEGPTEVADAFLNDQSRIPFTAADIRFTTRADIVYAVALDWPEDDTLTLRTLARGTPDHPGAVATVELLGHRQPLTFAEGADGLQVRLPPCPPGAVLPVLRITPCDRRADARRFALRT